MTEKFVKFLILKGIFLLNIRLEITALNSVKVGITVRVLSRSTNARCNLTIWALKLFTIVAIYPAAVTIALTIVETFPIIIIIVFIIIIIVSFAELYNSWVWSNHWSSSPNLVVATLNIVANKTLSSGAHGHNSDLSNKFLEDFNFKFCSSTFSRKVFVRT